MNKPVLSCVNLAKSYDEGKACIQVLRSINLEVSSGQMVAVVGSSGSGKSTLLHLLAGLDKPTTGKVFLKEKCLHELPEEEKCWIRNHYLGFIYQFHHLLPEFSALENVGMPLLIRGEEPQVILNRASELLELVGLKDRMQHRLGELSGGERQRVAIARALATNPACILADEPTGNLDPQNAEKVLELFFDLQKKQNTSVVMVTHDPGIARRADRVFKIINGGLETVS
ncbi:MAG TPA: ATP-binding cassette domain-containing protein [Gammaproteobacteria bacterium]|jgi:lipoprotein-releasing system ATP-binding protein|nr:ATP-binding cassette domain-containing protein [Gammaproteobacteria bacterium]